MKVFSKVVFDMETLEVTSEESYEYEGPVAECKGGTSTSYIQSPEAGQALSAVMPALQNIGRAAGQGSQLYDVPTSPWEQVGSIFQGAMPSAQNIGSIDPNIQSAIARPFEQAMGQVVEQFGGGMGSARGGVSGVGAKTLMNASQELIPQYTQALWNTVQPAALAGAQAQSSLLGQEWGANVSSMQAPYAPSVQIAGGAMPTPLGSTSKK